MPAPSREGDAGSVGSAGSPNRIGVAMLGHGFMGDAHTRAFRAIGSVTWPAPLRPDLVAVCGRDIRRLELSRARYGWARGVMDWRELPLEDEDVGLFDNVGPNSLHVEPTRYALRLRKHVVCEKPLAPTAEAALELWREAEEAGVIHACAFNYRFFPAVRIAKDMIDAGDLGELLHFRSQFYVPQPRKGNSGWRLEDPSARGGALADLVSHHVDVAHFLLGDVDSVVGVLVGPPGRGDAGGDLPEAAAHAVLTFTGGATGVVDASRLLDLPTVVSKVEVGGSRASVRFSLATLNELQVRDRAGTRVVHATDPEAHPYLQHWYPLGHPIGWDDSFVYELDHVLRVIAGERDPGVMATFADGYRCAEVCDAIRQSATERTVVSVRYRVAKRDQVAAQ